MSNHFTQEEIDAAEKTRAIIIEGDLNYLKGIYMAGEVNMWNEMRKSCEPLEARIRELEAGLEALVALKRWKDRYGKDEHYEKHQPAAWDAAKQLLNPTT